MKALFRSPRYKKIVSVLGALIILLLTFQAGMAVGFHRAEFGHRFDENYMNAYGRHPEMRHEGFRDEPFESHGAVGRVLSVSLPTMVVDDKHVEKIVRVSSSTMVRHLRDRVDVASIKPNDFIVVIGEPNEQSEVVAKFIRTLPPPPDFVASTTLMSSHASSTNN